MATLRIVNFLDKLFQIAVELATENAIEQVLENLEGENPENALKQGSPNLVKQAAERNLHAAGLELGLPQLHETGKS